MTKTTQEYLLKREKNAILNTYTVLLSSLPYLLTGSLTYISPSLHFDKIKVIMISSLGKKKKEVILIYVHWIWQWSYLTIFKITQSDVDI